MRAMLVLATFCVFAALAGAAGALTPPPGPATIHLEVIAAGHDIGLPPDSAQLQITDVSDGSSQTLDTQQMNDANGQHCPGVGPLCTGDVTVTAAASGSQFSVSVVFGPDDRVPVYSSDCNGAGNANGTRGALNVAKGQTAVCRITFVRPDTTAGDTPDSALLVSKTFETDSLRPHPDGHLELSLGSFSPDVFWPLRDLRDSSSSGRCPLSDPAPVCELAITLGGDIWSPIPPRLDEETDSDWIPLYGGDCDRFGQLNVDGNPDGDLFLCTVDNVHLEAQSSPDRNAVLRIQVDAPTDTSNPKQTAHLEVTDHNGADLADIGVKAHMRLADGSGCQGLGPDLCTGDVGIETTGQLQDFRIIADQVPTGYTLTFSDGCSGAPNGFSSTFIALGKGQLATCHITFVPPPPPPDTTPPAVSIQLTSPNSGVPDGQNGWFITGPVTGTVSADDTGAGGSNIASLDCGSLSLATSGLGTPTATGTFAIAAEGLTHISCSALDAAGNTGGPATADVKLDTQAPSVSLDAAANGCSLAGSNGWCRGTQTAGFTASDGTSGLVSPCSGSSCKFTQSTSIEGSSVTISSGSACDAAGNCNVGINAGPFQIDSTAPGVTRHSPADSCTPAGSNGWCRGTQTAGFTATDGTSVVASPCSGASCDFTKTSSTEGAAITIASGQVCDAASNCNAGIVAGPFQIDSTAPAITRHSSADSCSLPGSNGWCRGTQTAGFTASDGTSGVASPCSGSSSCDFTKSRSTDGTAVTIASGQVCDVAGNCNAGINAGPFQIDSTAPGLAPTVSPSPVLLHGSATATPNATDGTSGVASQSCGAVDTGTPGAHTVACTATDNAGNARNVQFGYVVEYRILGFFSPVPNSKWKQGQNVPVKFALADANGVRISDADAQALLAPSCRVVLSGAGAQTTSACVKYDLKNHQFVYDWKLGPQTGNETIMVTVSYPGSTGTSSISEPIVITS